MSKIQQLEKLRSNHRLPVKPRESASDSACQFLQFQYKYNFSTVTVTDIVMSKVQQLEKLRSNRRLLSSMWDDKVIRHLHLQEEVYARRTITRFGKEC
ncbi:hypothetical protein J6590_002504 [Homalodisca vitripennis]|nr:hypothetical protein J6590_002504 [Homalodisca vitripennis]